MFVFHHVNTGPLHTDYSMGLRSQGCFFQVVQTHSHTHTHAHIQENTQSLVPPASSIADVGMYSVSKQRHHRQNMLFQIIYSFFSFFCFWTIEAFLNIFELFTLLSYFFLFLYSQCVRALPGYISLCLIRYVDIGYIRTRAFYQRLDVV